MITLEFASQDATLDSNTSLLLFYKRTLNSCNSELKLTICLWFVDAPLRRDASHNFGVTEYSCMTLLIMSVLRVVGRHPTNKSCAPFPYSLTQLVKSHFLEHNYYLILEVIYLYVWYCVKNHDNNVVKITQLMLHNHATFYNDKLTFFGWQNHATSCYATLSWMLHLEVAQSF